MSRKKQVLILKESACAMKKFGFLVISVSILILLSSHASFAVWVGGKNNQKKTDTTEERMSLKEAESYIVKKIMEKGKEKDEPQEEKIIKRMAEQCSPKEKRAYIKFQKALQNISKSSEKDSEKIEKMSELLEDPKKFGTLTELMIQCGSADKEEELQKVRAEFTKEEFDDFKKKNAGRFTFSDEEQ